MTQLPFKSIMDLFIKWFQSIPSEMWQGALIGAIVSAAFAASFSFLRKVILKLRSELPIRKILGEFADNNSPCSIFLKEMHSEDGYYYSTEPDYFPPHTANRKCRWQNVPHVISDSDVQAATDFTNLLGQVAKREKVTFRSIARDWDLWSENLLSVGGNFKTDRIFELQNPRSVNLVNNDAFRFTDSDQLFQAINGNDYGLIYKVTHPNTGKICIVLMGLGVRGTEAAGYFFRSRASILGKMFGDRDFALLVHVRIDHGKETASPCWYFPEPLTIKKLLHPVIWNSMFKSLKGNPA
jgi:hypothetical protein